MIIINLKIDYPGRHSIMLANQLIFKFKSTIPGGIVVVMNCHIIGAVNVCVHSRKKAKCASDYPTGFFCPSSAAISRASATSSLGGKDTYSRASIFYILKNHIVFFKFPLVDTSSPKCEQAYTICRLVNDIRRCRVFEPTNRKNFTCNENNVLCR